MTKVLYYLYALFVCAFGTKSDLSVRAIESDVTYYLYTSNNVENGHFVKSVNANLPHFDPSKNTYLLIHGWVDNYMADVNTYIKSAIFNKQQANVFVVDWSPVAEKDYFTAAKALSSIGQYVANFVNDLVDTYGISANSISIIGHSMGAHIAGNAGSAIKTPVKQIIGLDPAGPTFSDKGPESRLDASDAKYVQVIHTSTRFIGFAASMGHVDYYPNGGKVQAGCGIDIGGGCSHARPFHYLAEAINGGKFTATKCNSYSDYQNNKCASNQKALMGSLEVDPRIIGDYYLDTNTEAPFAQG